MDDLPQNRHCAWRQTQEAHQQLDHGNQMNAWITEVGLQQVPAPVFRSQNDEIYTHSLKQAMNAPVLALVKIAYPDGATQRCDLEQQTNQQNGFSRARAAENMHVLGQPLGLQSYGRTEDVRTERNLSGQ